MKNKKLLFGGPIILAVLALSAMFLLNDSWNVIDLRRSMPRGNFLQASIVGLDDEGGKIICVLFEIPDSRMQEFEKRFKECVEKARQDAKQYRAVGSIIRLHQLRIVTDKGKYAAYLIWTGDYVYFRGLESKELRKVLFDMGFKGVD